MTSCMTCYVISNHTSFCYIVDSANEMHLRKIAQLCAGVPKTLQNVVRLHIVVFYNKSPFIPKCCFIHGGSGDGIHAALKLTRKWHQEIAYRH